MADDYDEDGRFDDDSDQHDESVWGYEERELVEDGLHHYESEAEDSEDDSPNGFLDLEASEAESGSTPEANSEAHDAHDLTFPASFPKFMQLPMELREMIWKQFCPDLDTKPRVFELMSFDPGQVQLAAHVEQQTVPIRTVLAVHRESRLLGLRFSPHRVELPHNQGVVPYHKDRDVLYLNALESFRGTSTLEDGRSISLVTQAAPGLQNIALSYHDMPTMDARHLTGFRNIFVVTEADQIPTKGLTWCVSETTQLHHVEVEEVEPGLGEDLRMLFCWPDVEKWGKLGEEEISNVILDFLQWDDDEEHILDSESAPLPFSSVYYRIPSWVFAMSGLRYDLYYLLLDEKDRSRWTGILNGEGRDGLVEDTPLPPLPPQANRVWPMTRFMFEGGIQRFNTMKAWRQPWGEWGSEADSLDDSDEYESDGIDDDSLDDSTATDDEDDLPAHLLDQDIVSAGFMSGSEELSGLDQAQFSSDSEVEDEDAGGSEPGGVENTHTRRVRIRRRALSSDSDNESTTEAGEPSLTTNAAARSVVDDSTDDDDDDGRDDAPRSANSATRRSRAAQINSDSEDEDVVVSTRAAASRRTRPVPIPDDSEDDSDGDTAPQPSRATNRRARAAVQRESEDEDDAASDTPQNGAEAQDGSSSSGGEEESSDEAPPPPKRVSLAKRLRMEYQQSRADRRSADGSDEDPDGSSGASGHGDEDSSDGDGLVMGMAEEGEEDDEDGEEGW